MADKARVHDKWQRKENNTGRVCNFGEHGKTTNKSESDGMLPEYNLEGKKGVRGKYAKAMQKGYSVRVLNEDGTVTVRDFIPKENTVLLDPDVKEYFPDSESVNHALRSLISLIPEKKASHIAENHGRYIPK